MNFEQDDSTIFFEEIDGRSTIMYRDDTHFEVRVLIEEGRYFYMQASSPLEGMSDDTFIENMKNFISKCVFVSGAWTDL